MKVAILHLVVFEYPVFRTDILPEGYRVIKLGDKWERGVNGLVRVGDEISKRVAREVDEVLSRGWQWGDYNYRIAKKYHSLRVLRRHLEKVIE